MLSCRLLSNAGALPVHVGLNNLDLAFEWLHKGYEERDVWLAFTKCDCNFDRIQSDARFTQLCRNLGLE